MSEVAAVLEYFLIDEVVEVFAENLGVGFIGAVFVISGSRFSPRVGRLLVTELQIAAVQRLELFQNLLVGNRCRTLEVLMELEFENSFPEFLADL